MRHNRQSSIGFFYYILFTYLCQFFTSFHILIYIKRTPFRTLLFFNPHTRVGCDKTRRVKTPPHPIYLNPRTHMENGVWTLLTLPQVATFKSTHPCGVRPFLTASIFTLLKFKSTHPMWGATKLTVSYKR